MKTGLFIIICLFFSIGMTYSQNIKITEPEFTGIILYVNDTIGEGVRLEHQTATFLTELNESVYDPNIGQTNTTATSKNIVNGNSSPIKIANRDKIQLIVKVANNNVDPVSTINIFKLKSENDRRTLELVSAKASGGSVPANIQYIPFSAKKYGTSSYLIEIRNIEQGEYAMTLPERRDIFYMFCIQ